MIIIHAVQKLLNISKLKPAMFISMPSPSQELHSWYAGLISTSFPGKFLTMYVHDPSLVIVLARGKTISGTLPEFYNRLEALLKRNIFDAAFVGEEMKLVKEGFVISKTRSKSILGSMNAISYDVEFVCRKAETYDQLNLDDIEDSFMDWMTRNTEKPHHYRRTSDYWKNKGLIQ